MLILIGGVSRSGKSALAEALQESLPNAIALHQDDYVLPEEALPYIRDMHDWEVPASMDWAQWEKTIADALRQNKFVIAEGILAYLPLKVFVHAELSIYMEIDFNTFLNRRKADLRWGERPDWYYQHVWEAHFQYGLPPKDAQVLHLDGRQPLRENLERAMAAISNRMAE